MFVSAQLLTREVSEPMQLGNAGLLALWRFLQEAQQYLPVAPVVAPEDESKLFFSRDYGNTFCRRKNGIWNAAIRRAHDLMKDLSRMLDTAYILLSV
jgi:hypothetical protein